MSDVLVSRLDCAVVGIEVSPAAAKVAASHCERVIVGDAEAIDLCEVLGGDRFDVILFADVLEHLRDPGALLQRVRPFLVEGGSVIASIPNVAHGSVRLALLRGEFRYRELGLLDNTHLRFFTRESIQDLFEESGYLVAQWVRKRDPIDQTEIRVPKEPAFDAARMVLEDDHEATTYQFVVRAVRLAPDLPSTESELRRVRAMLADQTRTAAEREAQLATERAAVEQQRRLIAEREEELSAMKQRCAGQAQALETTNATLAAITSSRSWRVARRLSAVLGSFVPRKRGESELSPQRKPDQS
jgi:SAM-dependent methyltransferase